MLREREREREVLDPVAAVDHIYSLYISYLLSDCQMSCHVHCKDKAVPTCPLPPGQGTYV